MEKQGLLHAYCREMLPFLSDITYKISTELRVLLHSKELDEITGYEKNEQNKKGADIAADEFPFPIVGYDSLEIFNTFLDTHGVKPFSHEKKIHNAREQEIQDHRVEKHQIEAIYHAVENFLSGVTKKVIIPWDSNISIESADDFLFFFESIGLPEEYLEKLEQLSPMDTEEPADIDGLYEYSFPFTSMCRFFLEELLQPLLSKWSTIASVQEVEKEWKPLLKETYNQLSAYKNLLLEQLDDDSSDEDIVHGLKKKIGETHQQYLQSWATYQEMIKASIYAENANFGTELLQSSISRSITEAVPFEFGGKIYSTPLDIVDLAEQFLFEFKFIDKFSVEETERLHKYLLSYER